MGETEEKRTNDLNNDQVRQLTEQLTSDYSKYFSVDTSAELKNLEENIEEHLAHLEEFCGILDVLREDNASVCGMIPVLKEKSAQMEELYRNIDSLENLVKTVRETVNSMESAVTKAEELFGNTSRVKKLFSFLNNRRKPTGDLPTYKEPHIFRTSQFFDNKISASQETKSTAND